MCSLELLDQDEPTLSLLNDPKINNILKRINCHSISKATPILINKASKIPYNHPVVFSQFNQLFIHLQKLMLL